MFISTRELLGQLADRETHQAVIERHCGQITGVESLLSEPLLGPILNEMGARALSNEALELLAKTISSRDKGSVASRF